MVPFDLPFAFVAGGAIGWRARGKRRDLALAYAGLGLAAPGVAFLEAYPAWDWSYFIDPATLPSWTPGLFVGLVVGLALAGHEVGARYPRALLPVAAFVAAYPVVVLKRMLYVGTFEEFARGEAVLWPGHFLAFATAWIGLSAIVAAAVVVSLERGHAGNAQ